MFSVVILQRHTVHIYLFIFEFLLMPVDPLFHVTLWALLFRELTWGLPLCVSALIVDQSVQSSASGVQCWSCSQPSSSPSLSVLAGQKHCLIRHWGRWPPPIFFFPCKTSQSLGSTPPLVRRSGLSAAAFFWIFFFFCATL